MVALGDFPIALLIMPFNLHEVGYKLMKDFVSFLFCSCFFQDERDDMLRNEKVINLSS